jgi:menaquinol-cytochrome c reductase iron-sulfur subunit
MQESQQHQPETRRSFHLAVLYGLWSVITAMLAIPAGIYLLIPPRSRKAAEWVEAADASGLRTGVPEEVIFRRNRQDGWKITSEKASAWIVKRADGQVVAFAPQCTHLGCAYHWDDRRSTFVCPCHTSAFDLEGKVLMGPAPRPLDRYEVKVNGSKVLVGQIRRAEA